MTARAAWWLARPRPLWRAPKRRVLERQGSVPEQSGGGSIGNAKMQVGSQDGWQEVRNHRDDTFPRDGNTGCAPEDPARQRRAAQRMVEASYYGSIAMLPPTDAAEADAPGAAGKERTPGARLATLASFTSPASLLPMATHAEDVGGGIGQAAGGNIVSTIAPGLTRQVQHLHQRLMPLLVIMLLSVSADCAMMLKIDGCRWTLFLRACA